MAQSSSSRKSNCLLDMHVHLRGSLEPQMAIALARQHGRQLDADLLDGEGKYMFDGFTSFLDVYQRVGSIVRAADDLRKIGKKYLLSAAKEGAVYVEFMLSPQHSIINGIPWDAQVDALTAAIEDCSCQIDASLIVTVLRHHGPEDALRIANMVSSKPSRIVRGFGLTGNENKFSAAEFAPAFCVAAGAGLGLTAHAGEWCDAATVFDAVKALKLSRVGHGISIVNNTSILNELVDMGIGFEICQAANYALGAVRLGTEHPVALMAAAGCKIVLGTDDPAFFCTNIRKEYASVLGLVSDEKFANISKDAIGLAFCDEAVRHRLTCRMSDVQ